MSSAIYLRPKEPIALADWEVFCEKQGIGYSPQTIGQNVFYCDGVEITFGEFNDEELPRLPSGRLDFGAARPRETAERVSLSVRYGSGVGAAIRLARAACRRWPSFVDYNPECRFRLPPGSHKEPPEPEEETRPVVRRQIFFRRWGEP